MQGRSRTAGLALVLAFFLVGAKGAQAVTFTVNSAANDADLAINGTCDTDATADVDCTLRAAVEEANATAASDTVGFNGTNTADPDDVFFDGGAGSTLSAPPTITEATTINGGNCASGPLPGAPCVNTVGGWTVDAEGEVSIEGLSFGGNLTAIRVVEINGDLANTPDFQLHNNWFGIDGAQADVVPPTTAVLLEDVSGARIGSGFAEDRNVFARQGIGLDVLGADNTEVFGNFFGVMPDGVTFARDGESGANGDNIEVTGNTAPNPDDPALGSVIGATNADHPTPPVCDGSGGCNLLTNAGVSGTGFDGNAAGIDLIAEGGDGELPVDGVDILGNRIGGTTNNNGRGVAIGDADNVTLGGPSPADGNVIGANEVTSFAGAAGISVQNNAFGAPTGSPALVLQGSGAVLDNLIPIVNTIAAIQLTNTSPPNFAVQGNVIGEQANGTAGAIGGVGIDLTATATGNLIGGTAPGDGNVIGQSEFLLINGFGLRIAGDDNQVVGNRLGVNSGGSARPLRTGVLLLTDADGNQIGGDTPASENLISNINNGNLTLLGNAIEIRDAASDDNEILRNRGSGNEGAFIDLGADGPGNLAEPNGPNGGAQAPAIASASLISASGTAVPGALVRVFTKSVAAPGELAGYLTETTADGSGAWSVGFPAVAAGQLLAASATTPGGTSELSGVTAATATDLPAPPATDTAPPETAIDKAPPKKLKRKKATIAFSANEPSSTFECRLDRKPFAACTSPTKLKRLKRGKHTFEVVATDVAGNSDPTPAKHRFKVKRKR